MNRYDNTNDKDVIKYIYFSILPIYWYGRGPIAHRPSKRGGGMQYTLRQTYTHTRTHNCPFLLLSSSIIFHFANCASSMAHSLSRTFSFSLPTSNIEINMSDSHPSDASIIWRVFFVSSCLFSCSVVIHRCVYVERLTASKIWNIRCDTEKFFRWMSRNFDFDIKLINGFFESNLTKKVFCIVLGVFYWRCCCSWWGSSCLLSLLLGWMVCVCAIVWLRIASEKSLDNNSIQFFLSLFPLSTLHFSFRTFHKEESKKSTSNRFETSNW